MTEKTKKKILDKIEIEKIEPVPKSHFDWKNRILWMLIGVAIFFGIAFASFLIDDAIEFIQFGPGFFNGFSILFFIPHLFWIILLSIIAFFAYKEFRDTKTGYKYSKKGIFAVLGIVVILGSLIFFKIGAGPRMHTFVKGTPFVPNILYDEKTWNYAEDGRIAGNIIEVFPDEVHAEFFIIKSFDSKDYKIFIKEGIFISPMVKISTGEKVRIFGRILTPPGPEGIIEFEAKGIMPWFSNGMKGHMRGMMRGGFNEDRLPPPEVK